MSYNTNQSAIDARRQAVAELALAGNTQRAIAEKLATEKKMVGADGLAWSVGTINSDIKAVQAEWKESAKEKIGEHIGKQYARTESIIEALWPDRSHPRVAEVLLQAMKRQAELLGMDKPTKQKIDQTVDGQITQLMIDLNGVSDEQKQAAIETAARRLAERASSHSSP